MLVIVLLLLPSGMALLVHRGFALMMQRERDRALSEEAAIARALKLEIGAGGFEQIQATAQTVQRRYGSDRLRVQLAYHGMGVAGAVLPEGTEELLKTAARATLLDGETRTLYIAHALDADLMLLLASDVSPVYAFRARLGAWAAGLCAAGAALCALLTLILSGMLMRPVAALSRAARSLAAGDYGVMLPKAEKDEIGELTNAFAAMTQAVGERERALEEEAARRQRLIDALAHEIRTPLTAIIGGARLMQQANIPQKQQERLLEMMVREAQRLSDMDERLMRLVRLSHDALERVPFSLLKMAKEALSVFDGVLLTGDDAWVSGDRELTIELLRNLVENAQRAGGNTPVCVQLNSDGFAVKDTGCGMTPQQTEHAFEPFYKADKARTRKAGGAGLGLTLCAQIARLHRGSLTVETQIGKGTTVTYHCGKDLQLGDKSMNTQ